MGVRALGAFSGGLDGIVSALLLMEQGIEVELATFVSPFFSSDAGREAAVSLGLKWKEIDFTEDILSILKDPPSGFGKNCNPCIDCHAMMFRRLGDTASQQRFDFIFSGEVLGQRPMSQNRNSLNRVSRLSGYRDILLRPLSAKLLLPTGPESSGLVNREKLLDLSGRGRKSQMKFLMDRGLEVPGSGGGCLLTEPNFCTRLKLLMNSPGLLTPSNAWLITSGRMFVLSTGNLCLVGRSEGDNMRLEELADDRVTVELKELPGPTGLMISREPDWQDVQQLASLVALYGKVPNEKPALMVTGDGTEFTVVPAERSQADDLLVKL